jgi:hypothetical protein
MKVFVAQQHEKEYISATEYHWCDDNDILIFGQFQLGKGNPSEVSMCGINSRTFTTFITVKDLNIDREFYKELITASIENGMNTTIDRNGDYEIDIAWGFHFNINDIIDELLEKASRFNDGDRVICRGREITLKPDIPYCDMRYLV